MSKKGKKKKLKCNYTLEPVPERGYVPEPQHYRRLVIEHNHVLQELDDEQKAVDYWVKKNSDLEIRVETAKSHERHERSLVYKSELEVLELEERLSDWRMRCHISLAITVGVLAAFLMIIYDVSNINTNNESTSEITTND